jgi:hypothetical protein
MLSNLLSHKGARSAKFRNRENLSSQDWYERFYASVLPDRDRVLQLLAELSDAVELEPGLLRPDDRWVEELKPRSDLFPDDSWFSMIVLADVCSRRYGKQVDLFMCPTVDAFIRRCCLHKDEPLSVS